MKPAPSIASHSQPRSFERVTRTLAGLEVVFFVLWVGITMWLILPLNRGGLEVLNVAAMMGFIAASHLWRRTPVASVGLHPGTLLPAVRLLALPTGVGLIGIVLAGLVTGELEISLSEALDIGLHCVSYPPWALLQQYAVLGFVFIRLREAFGRPGPAIAVAAALYAGFHYPNFLLVGLGFPVGLLWAWVFSRRPSLYAVAISHGVLGAFLSEMAASAYWAGMSVGSKLFLN